MRVALVHYWIVNWRGGEKVLKAISELFPSADIFAHVVEPSLVRREFPGRRVSTTFIARLPWSRRYYQAYLPLMPAALEQLDLRGYDLVISSESGPAKGVVVDPGATHICYCHSPMRYVWDLYHQYREQSGRVTRAVMAPLLHYVRLWDQVSAQRVDHYVANSQFVARRIDKYYRRTASVIHPPVAVDDFDASRPAEDFYLSVGQLVSYKRADLLVDAFNALGKPLTVIGGGALLKSLRRRARANVRLLGSQPFDVIRDHYAKCRAVVFPGIEDFGMVPVEAMASGKPVICYARGGVLETIIDGSTGVMFHEQTADCLADAVLRFESQAETFDTELIRTHARQFSEPVFKSRFKAFVERALASDPRAV
jgi:glycosyltransferase involved in cell wall biosynthesis